MIARPAIRKAVRALTVALLLGLLLVAGGFYWLGSQHGLAWIVRQAVAASEGRLALDGIAGSIYGRVTLSRVTFKDDTIVINADDVVLEWQPMALRRHEAYISQLIIGTLRIATADTDPEKPPQQPVSLRLPIGVILKDAHVRRIELNRAVLGQDLHFRLHASAQTHQLEIIDVAALGARGAGTFHLGTASPFAAGGAFEFSRKLPDESIKARVTIGGSLDALQLHASATARGASAKATALLHPYSALLLGNLSLDADNVDLAAYDKTLPHTRLSMVVATGMPARQRFAGTLRMSNDTPGPIDRQRLPLSRAALSFAGSGTNWTFSDIDLGIGKSGHARGSGSTDGTQLRLQLALDQIGTTDLHRQLKPMVVSGVATLSGDANAQQVNAKLAGAGVRLEVVAQLAQQVVTIERGMLRAGDARFDFTGHAALAAQREFSMDAAFSRLDPARFLNTPPARLNGKVTAQGLLAPAWQAQVKLTLANSTLRGQPLSANAAFTTGEKQWLSGEAHALYGGNRIDVSGRFGMPGDKLQWSVDAANLKVIHKSLAGSVKAQGTFGGSMDSPSVEFSMSARQIAAGDIAAHSITAQGAVTDGRDGQVRLSARIAGGRSGALLLDAISVTAQGTRLRHEINAAVRGSKFDASLSAAGGVDEHWRWIGSVSALESQGRFPLRLASPARLTVGGGLLEIDGLHAATLGGHIGPASVHIAPGAIATRGAFTGITAKSLLHLMPQNAIDPRNATVGGQWDAILKEAASGAATIHLEKGDLGVVSAQGMVLGLRHLTLNVTARDNHIDAVFDALSTPMGAITAQVRTRVERRDAAWVLTKNAPLDGSVVLDMQSLAWVRAFTPSVDEVGGRASARLKLSGTVGQPLVLGDIGADALQVRAIGPGMNLTEGTLRATVDGRRLNISKFYLKAGEGRIEADGVADFSDGLRSFAISARATRARILSSPQLTMVLSGAGHAGLRDLQLALDGKFKVDEGRYDLGSERTRTLGDDVVVVGQSRVADPGRKPLRVLIDVTLDLNDKFAVRGHGLDAVLGGALRTTTRNGALQAFGTIHTVRGEYFAFGQELKIERGSLSFSGPLNNPGLDLRAGRQIRTVEVGVEVRGSLRRPVVQLASEPAMSDSERLGWLVLGRDPQTANAAELAILQAAALTNDPHKMPIQKRIAEGLGIDQFGFSRGANGGLGVLALGKRITDRLTVRLEQTVGGTAAGLLKIDYLLSPRWRLEGTAGAENAADIIYTLRFD